MLKFITLVVLACSVVGVGYFMWEADAPRRDFMSHCAQETTEARCAMEWQKDKGQ